MPKKSPMGEELVQVRLTENFRTGLGHSRKGDVVEVHPARAKRMIAQGVAEEVVKRSNKKKVETPEDDA